MSASIYGTLEWCSLNQDEITEIVDRIYVDHIYKGEDFYNEVKKLGAWRPVNEGDIDDSVCIWNSDDAGPITIDGKEIGLFVHYDEDDQKFDWACTYQLCEKYKDLTPEESWNGCSVESLLEEPCGGMGS